MKKETDESPARIDEFVAWWKGKNRAEPDVFRLDDGLDGDSLYMESYFDWDSDGDVDMEHARELLADEAAGLLGPHSKL